MFNSYEHQNGFNVVKIVDSCCNCWTLGLSDINGLNGPSNLVDQNQRLSVLHGDEGTVVASCQSTFEMKLDFHLLQGFNHQVSNCLKLSLFQVHCQG